MSKTVETRKRHKWRGRTKLFALGALVFISALIYWEQAALLYVASTVLICAVLLAVAFADLESKDRKSAQATEGSDVPEVSAP